MEVLSKALPSGSGMRPWRGAHPSGLLAAGLVPGVQVLLELPGGGSRGDVLVEHRLQDRPGVVVQWWRPGAQPIKLEAGRQNSAPVFRSAKAWARGLLYVTGSEPIEKNPGTAFTYRAWNSPTLSHSRNVVHHVPRVAHRRRVQALYVNAVPGFFSMGSDRSPTAIPLGQAFADLKTGAELTPRLQLDRLTPGRHRWTTTPGRYCRRCSNEDVTATAATGKLQKDLDSWYRPSARVQSRGMRPPPGAHPRSGRRRSCQDLHPIFGLLAVFVLPLWPSTSHSAHPLFQQRMESLFNSRAGGAFVGLETSPTSSATRTQSERFWNALINNLEFFGIPPRSSRCRSRCF